MTPALSSTTQFPQVQVSANVRSSPLQEQGVGRLDFLADPEKRAR
jgi:hypothetical protein